MAVKIGQIIDEYKILEKIGSGGNGIVYKAKSESTKQIVAIKFPLSDGISYDSNMVENFKNEIAAIMRLENPYIAQPISIGIYKINESQVVPYLVMEFVEGVPLSEFKNMPIRSIVILMAKVCECISYAHQKRVIHKDLKPSNIIVDIHGNPKILDFGLAKLLDQFSSDASFFEGSPSYAAPEQFSGDKCDERTDIWTLGVILFELLTGKLPFVVENWEELSDSRMQIFAAQEKIINNKLLKPSKINEDIDSILDEVCLKTMVKIPEKRYQSAEEMTARLKQWARVNRDKEFKKAKRSFIKSQMLPSGMRQSSIQKTLDRLQKATSYDVITPAIKELIINCFCSKYEMNVSVIEIPLPQNLTINEWENIHTRLEKIKDIEHSLIIPVKEIFLCLGNQEKIPHQVLLICEHLENKNTSSDEQNVDTEDTMETMRNTINIINYCKNIGLYPFLPNPAQIFPKPFKAMVGEWLWKKNDKDITSYDFMAFMYHIIADSSFEPDIPNWQKIPDIFRDILESVADGTENIKTPQQLIDAIEKKIQTYKIIEKGILDRNFSFPPGEYSLNTTLKIHPKGCLELTGNTILKFAPGTGIQCLGQILIHGNWNEGSEDGSITLKPLSGREGWAGIQFSGSSKANTSVIRGCNIEGGRGQTEDKGAISGGAIYIENGSFSFSQVRFADNKVDGDGGAIHISDRVLANINLEIKHCLFTSNQSQRHGGAICNYSSSKITIKECRFENNRAIEDGGVLYSKGIDNKKIATVEISETAFLENRSNMSGGALCLGFFCNTQIKSCEYDSNISEDHGGAISAIGKNNMSDIQIAKTKFLANRTQNRGGAISARKNVKISVKNSRFDGNSSIRDSGGAIAIDGKGSKNYSTLELSNVIFIENRCHIDGGAVNVNILSKITSNDCRFEGNYTESNSGGAIVIVGDKEKFSEGVFTDTIFIRNRCKLNGGAINANIYTKTIYNNCRFKNNSSEDSGGAIEIAGVEDDDNFSEAAFKDVTFTNNRCKTFGGAVNAADYIRINFDGCQFESNRSEEDAGAISVKGTDERYSEVTFRKTQFIENRSKFSAGAVYLNVLTRSKFEECLFNANYAETKNAGAILVSGKKSDLCTEISCNKVHFIQNYCKGDGGAINLGFYSLCVLNDVRFERNTSENSGGAIGLVGKDDNGPTKVTLKKAVLSENTCKVDGGAIAAGPHTQIIVSDCSFQGNMAEANCGAVGIVGKVNSEPSKAKFKRVSFIENSCKGDGGAIAAGVRSRLIFEGCNFEGNSAEGSCGAIGLAGKDNKNLSDATFSDVTFIGNHASTDGGAMVVGKFSRVKCNNSSFLQNYAEFKTGGALLILGGHPLFPSICNFQGVKFEKNHCAVDGGAINANIYSRLVFEECSFVENHAQEKNGGAIVLLGKDSSCYTEASFKQVEFIKNRCYISGGAVNANDFTRSLYVDCIFEENRALSKNGGALLILGENSQEPSDAKFTNVKFIKNYAQGSGGAVNAHVYTITHFEDCEWQENVADENGGGVFIRGLRRVPNKSQIRSCHFANNVAGNIGPDVALHAVKGVTEESLIEDNTFDIPDEEAS